MELIAISINYKQVPVEVREMYAFAEGELAAAMAELKKEQSILENVILSTCNRTEIYAVVDQIRRGEDYIKRFLANWFHIDQQEVEQVLISHQGFDEVARYLYRVACGLESLIMGEEQILAQVKASLAFAQENQATSSILNQLFKEAITLSKRAHTETALSRNSVSVGSAAVQLAKQEGFDFHGAKALVIGAGQMAELSATYLQAQKIERLHIANRTLEKAEKLASKQQASASSLDDLEAQLVKADIVFSATSAKKPLITESLIRIVREKRAKAPLYIFDLAVPRDVEPEVQAFDEVQVFDVDAMRQLIDDNLVARQEAVQVVEGMIDEKVVDFETWFSSLEAVPVIKSLQAKGMKVQADVFDNLTKRLPELDDHQTKVIHKLTRSIVNQLLRDPILAVKDLSQQEDSAEKLALIEQIFAIK
ncbi:glutamyl-tRNA reductase [Lactococcus termiticola]|uniref:Glutamyl-tRNA reductase n=1 Tax=Lactococcus termiticola TaxID=2169526 RepID=A0A2R5HH60_9LACT|nr:glutamyl-tRNA reductase [Lactococcus termiticola]GBG96685.1 glutamyl-tRNA reductase [Lactococcus termiticola]